MAQAQEVPAPSFVDENDEDAPISVSGNEILVVAPRMRGQLDVPQQPVETFDEEDIAAYGADSIAELIEAVSPQTGSGRGRGDGRPVMLVNGQRITSFREMRAIPPEAIRRMDVLPEEVALRFGYPANQRVVNIILKDQFAAVTGAGEYNVPTRGGYHNYEAEGGIFSVAGPRRYNFSAKLVNTSMLTADERNVQLEESIVPTVAGDPDPARFRSLVPLDHDFTLNGTMTQGLGEGGLDGQLTANATYTHTTTRSLSGLDTVTLTGPDGASAIRTLPDPLSARVETNAFQGGAWLQHLTGRLAIQRHDRRRLHRHQHAGGPRARHVGAGRRGGVGGPCDRWGSAQGGGRGG